MPDAICIDWPALYDTVDDDDNDYDDDDNDDDDDDDDDYDDDDSDDDDDDDTVAERDLNIRDLTRLSSPSTKSLLL